MVTEKNKGCDNMNWDTLVSQRFSYWVNELTNTGYSGNLDQIELFIFDEEGNDFFANEFGVIPFACFYDGGFYISNQETFEMLKQDASDTSNYSNEELLDMIILHEFGHYLSDTFSDEFIEMAKKINTKGTRQSTEFLTTSEDLDEERIAELFMLLHLDETIVNKYTDDFTDKEKEILINVRSYYL